MTSSINSGRLSKIISNSSKSLERVKAELLPEMRISILNSRLKLLENNNEGSQTLRDRFNINKVVYEYLKEQRQKKAQMKLEEIAIKPIREGKNEKVQSSEFLSISPKTNVSPKRASYFLKVLEERQKTNADLPSIEKIQEEETEEWLNDFEENENQLNSRLRRVNSLAGHDWRVLTYIPKDILEKKGPKPAGSLNSSFISFQDMKTMRPGLFPKLYEEAGGNSFAMADRIYERGKYDKAQDFRITRELKHNAEQKDFFQKTMSRALETVNHDLINQFSMRKRQNHGVQKLTHQKKMKKTQGLHRKINKMESGDMDSALEINIISNDYCFHWYDFDELVDKKPIAREGATLEFSNGFGYLIGGRNHSIIEEISVINLGDLSWEKIMPPKNSFEGFGRANHSSNILNGNLIIIFGGERSYDSRLKIRECLSDVKFFNLEKKEWVNQVCRGDVVEARRNHISQVLGKSFLVYGGLNSKDHVLNDLMVLDLGSLKWEGVLKNPKDLPFRAYHSAVSVFDSGRTIHSLFHTTVESKEPREAILLEGVYVFGGKNEEKKATNSLILLKIGSQFLKWEYLETKGAPPPPRYGHGMVFYPNMGVVAIHGGRNDENVACFNDLHILNVSSLSWCRVSLYDSLPPESRYSFACGIKGSKMFVFGGINFEGFTKAGMRALELDQNRARIKYEQQKGLYYKKYNRARTRKLENQMSSVGINQTMKILSYLPVPADKHGT